MKFIHFTVLNCGFPQKKFFGIMYLSDYILKFKVINVDLRVINKLLFYITNLFKLQSKIVNK